MPDVWLFCGQVMRPALAKNTLGAADSSPNFTKFHLHAIGSPLTIVHVIPTRVSVKHSLAEARP